MVVVVVVVVGLMLIAMTAVVESGGGDHHRAAAFATYSAVSVLPVNGTRVSSRRDLADQNRLFTRPLIVKLDPPRPSLGLNRFFSPTLNRNWDLDQR